MASDDVRLPLIVITGPTASGKTALAIRLAQRYGGEIICADSRTVYHGMDIGTAKPTPDERAMVPHWGLDLVEPGEPFSAALFKRYAQQKMHEIRARDRVPFLVGGTGLYIDAVLFDFQFADPPEASRRQGLMQYDLDQLHEYCKKNNIDLPENSHNPRHVMRAIERNGKVPRRRHRPIDNSHVVGITTELHVLRQRIEARAEQLLTDDVVKEAIILGKKYGWRSEAMTGNVYPLIHRFICGKINNDQLRTRFIQSDWHLAKRQLTWLRRNPFLCWATLDAAECYIGKLLAHREEL